MIPAWDQTGTPLHFHSSTTSGSASLMSARTRASVLPLQSPSSLILSSIRREGDSSFVAAVLVVAVFFIVGWRVSCQYVPAASTTAEQAAESTLKAGRAVGGLVTSLPWRPR